MDQPQSSAAKTIAKDGTRRLSINAAFLRDIKDDNRELKALIDRIKPITELPQVAANHWIEIRSLLADLRDQLALHFSLEEAFGYFEEAIETAPQLSMTAVQLRGDHPRLFEEIRAIADKAQEIEADQIEKVTTFLSRLHRFQRSFETHEEAEIKLIVEAMDDDIGGGD
ncbi:hypothetical protein K227x_02620 [Rubripirellula lacrimiformis]|uniref:Hemerythrin-like domain-containing protein n=1 Tax=Rubripirellula lacrimiformis TaxID=1930273 RepID=A0A517N433_9BACT|nr:hemerythrin domain-containing protein [Rubripirellula lacrimiformis]QDT01893.1 hypothetical protein K227x_02620 [Rubripirellula lacrimiformis]